MKEPSWLNREVCLALHDMMLVHFGGRAGLRDDHLLASALARPQQLFHYGKPTIAELASSYATGIVKNHPFIDGNKRTGFMAGAGFLELNGWEFFASEPDAVIQTLALAAGELSGEGYAAWLAANSRRIRR